MARNSTVTGWVGWAYFAATLIILVGGMQVIAGLVGIFNQDFYVATAAGLIAFDYTTWGWIHLIIGVLALATGAGIFTGAFWARIAGIVITVLAMLGNIAFITAFPLWSIAALVVGGFVIYALTMHGDELEVE